MGRWDWVLAAGFAAAALAEVVARSDLAWRPLVAVLVVALAPALLRRRSHPLLTCLVGFGVAGLLSVLQLVTRSADVGLSSMFVILILLFALVRWGSGREIVLGLPFVGAVVALGMVATEAARAELIGGSLLVLLFIALAAVFRYRADLWARRHREIRNEERLSLARELHDTVAHHVSAIAVQAQAGSVVIATQPQQAAVILAAIESEASRTLADMRAMVQVLRADEWDVYAPQQGVADLATLARRDGVPTVEVSVAASALGLPRPVDTAIYRLARESLTNATRHAQGATRVQIDVDRVGDVVRLRVTDDGLALPKQGTEPGYGLRGMAERAELLGGTLTAGPEPGGGWAVAATLPATMPT
ncbi:signal transduction histidine kinase [Kineosphaera limosa]|uniref:sensor histidine kinase n=1 Tax=Kineosphaera limosa TaxID=111564 RepID=UPI0002E46205|nr:histidine kinase [Kineosphaera limosa]NYE01143.1 signal transduction histidine kinase [Kineosphaera limosa]